MESRKLPRNWWNSNTKRQKIWFIISLILTVLVVFLAVLVISVRELGITELADSLFGYGVSGWKWLGLQIANGGIKIIVTIVIISVAVVVAFLINLVIGLITWKGKRARTVGSLVKSLIKYVVTIIAIGFILSSWGVDIASIVAGLGIITLIIGLGCQSLIADIVSGLFLVFDDFFDVDDIVIIDGFRGTISEIGLRSTKIIDWAGNIKSINNSQINTVTNLSRLATSFAITFVVDREEDIVKVESLINENLANIGAKFPKILEPLQYKGVSSLEETGIKLLFIAKSEEGDRFQVNRDVTRELYLLMKENNIKVPFNKLYITQEEKEVESPKKKEPTQKK